MGENNVKSGWQGWIGFAAVMLLLGGSFSAIAGLVALFKDTVVYNAASNVAWILSYNQWGWAHILAGTLAIIAAGSLMSGHMYGRIIAVLVAFLSAIVNVLFIPIYPVWSLLVVTVDVLVIFAVMVHGKELKSRE